MSRLDITGWTHSSGDSKAREYVSHYDEVSDEEESKADNFGHADSYAPNICDAEELCAMRDLALSVAWVSVRLGSCERRFSIRAKRLLERASSAAEGGV